MHTLIAATSTPRSYREILGIRSHSAEDRGRLAGVGYDLVAQYVRVALCLTHAGLVARSRRHCPQRPGSAAETHYAVIGDTMHLTSTYC